MSADREFEQLLHRLADDGELTDDEFARLAARLESDEAARAQYIRWRDQEANLYWAFAGTLSSESPASRAEPLPVSMLDEASRHPIPPSFIVAFAALALLLLGLALWPISRIFVDDPVAEHKSPTRSNVAELLRSVGATWGTHKSFVAQFGAAKNAAMSGGQSVRPQVGARLASGQWLYLERGVAEIAFDDGATVVLHGPCAFRVQDAGSGLLEFGKLVGRCATQRSVGFAVETPQGRVVDLGTEFGVDVGEEGETDIAVFEGKVAFHQSADRSAAGRQTLAAGESLRVSADGHINRAATADEQRFVRRVNDQWVGLGNVVAEFRRDFVPGVVGQPVASQRWKYLWNKHGHVGDPAHYEPLVWNERFGYTPDGTTYPLPPPASYLRITAEDAHPGIGSTQPGGNGTNRYVIAAYVVETPGRYEIVNSKVALVENKAVVNQSLGIMVHVDDAMPAKQTRALDDVATSFDVSLGALKAGQVIYVAVGPDGFAGNDQFYWNYAITCSPDSDKQPAEQGRQTVKTKPLNP